LTEALTAHLPSFLGHHKPLHTLSDVQGSARRARQRAQEQPPGNRRVEGAKPGSTSRGTRLFVH